MKFVIAPVTTEKSVSAIETQNKMTFAVEKVATKPQVKAEIEKDYNVKIAKITMQITNKGNKKATVTFAKEGQAADLAAKFKLV